jgi:hypothetical protein
MTLEDKKLALDASQFNSKQEYDKWALLTGVTETARDRAWKSAESATDRAWQSSESSAQRLLEKDIENGRINLEEAKLIEESLRFDDKLEYDKWAVGQGLYGEAADRTWKEGQALLDREFEAKMQDMADANGQVGMVIQGLMAAATANPENAPQLIATIDMIAKENGIDMGAYFDAGETKSALQDIQAATPGYQVVDTGFKSLTGSNVFEVGPNKFVNSEGDLQMLNEGTGMYETMTGVSNDAKAKSIKSINPGVTVFDATMIPTEARSTYPTVRYITSNGRAYSADGAFLGADSRWGVR